MTTPGNSPSSTEARPEIHSVRVSEQVGDYLPANLRVEFRKVEEGFEANLLKGLLESIPLLLPSVDEPDIVERLTHLGRAFRLADWRVSAQCEMRRNGRMLVERLLRTVPLLREDDVLSRLDAEQHIDVSDLMQVTFGDRTFYLADQFSPTGGVHAECFQVLRILKTAPEMSDWDVAVWWISSSGWLDGLTPRDIYQEDPSALYEAARQEIAENAS